MSRPMCLADDVDVVVLAGGFVGAFAVAARFFAGTELDWRMLGKLSTTPRQTIPEDLIVAKVLSREVVTLSQVQPRCAVTTPRKPVTESMVMAECRAA